MMHRICPQPHVVYDINALSAAACVCCSVAKKPDAGEREGMPLTVANMCYERQLIARPADPGAAQAEHHRAVEAQQLN
jgi:hypothetical protein